MSTDDAVKAEAEGKTTVAVKWRTLTPFEVPLYYSDLPFEAALAAEEQDNARLLVALLPAVTLREFGGMGCTVSDAMDLLGAISEARSIGSGESQASAG